MKTLKNKNENEKNGQNILEALFHGMVAFMIIWTFISLPYIEFIPLSNVLCMLGGVGAMYSLKGLKIDHDNKLSLVNWNMLFFIVSLLGLYAPVVEVFNKFLANGLVS
jgi:hypothetical protein